MPVLKKKSAALRAKESKSLMNDLRRKNTSTVNINTCTGTVEEEARKEGGTEEEKKKQMRRAQMKRAQDKRLLDPNQKLKHAMQNKECQKKRLKNVEKRIEHCSKIKERLQNPEIKSYNLEMTKKRLLISEKRLRNLELTKERLLIPENKERNLQLAKKRLLNAEKRHRNQLLVKERNLIPEKYKRNLQLTNYYYSNPENWLRNLERSKARLLNPETKQRNYQLAKSRLLNPEAKQRNYLLTKSRLLNPETKQRNYQLAKSRLLDINKRNRNLQIAKSNQARYLQDENKRSQQRRKNAECQRKRLSIEINRMTHILRSKKCREQYLENRSNKRRQLNQLKHYQRLHIGNVINQLECEFAALIKSRSVCWRSNHRTRMSFLTILKRNRLHKLKLKQKQNRLKHYRRVQLCQRRRIEKQEIEMRQRLYNSYKNDIMDTMQYICVSCDRLFFSSSLNYVMVESILNKSKKNKTITLSFLRECCPKMVSDTDIGYLCAACKRSLENKEKPRFSMCHKELAFPEVHPDVACLTQLEERFVSPRIPFMKILTREQCRVTGRSVNVPTDPEQNIDVLPRLPHATSQVVIALKRKKTFKSNILMEPVRPHAIAKALKVLDNCPIYREAGINIDYERLRLIAPDYFIDNDGEMNDNCGSLSISSDEEDDEPVNIEAEDTMIIGQAIAFAPGEGSSPLPIFLDNHAEAMSFIRIYGGQLKKYAKHLSYQEGVKHELMQSDRRAARNIEKIFFSTCYLRAKKIATSINICFRKHRIHQPISAGEVLSNGFIAQLVGDDTGYRMFLSDRSSPSFWELKKKEVFAMIRQLGPTTLFVTLSPAETKWGPLLKMLKKLVDNIDMTEEEALSLTYEEKARLIRSDPVACASYFKYRLNKLINLFKKKNSVFRDHNVKDFYYRIEFQQRGSPHCHCLIWLENAPIYTPGDNMSALHCQNFIDKFITCSRNNVSNDLISLQTHRHTFTCYKKKRDGVKKCRFNIPVFPMSETKILDPLDESINPIKLKVLQKKANEIKEFLNEFYRGSEYKVVMSFDDFLSKHNISMDEYIEIIRSTLKRPQVFLRRNPNEVFINAYNKDILQLHEGNMDIQFTLDVYSCAVYVLNYINKSNAGMSRTLRDALAEIRRGNFGPREKCRYMANKFLNSSECSAQEAVYYILGYPLSYSSRSTTFINTGPKENRVLMLKSNYELRQLSEFSSDIYKSNMTDYYSNRPDSLKDLCLADFVANYKYDSLKISASRGALVVRDEGEKSAEESDYEVEIHSKTKFKLKNCNGYVTKRTQPIIIRFVNYRFEQDENNYYREQVMLYLPWQNEDKDIINQNQKELYLKYHDVINKNRKLFNHKNSEEIYDVIQAAEDEEKSVDEFSKNTNQNNDNSSDEDHVQDGDIFVDMGLDINNKAADIISFPIPRFISEDEYYSLMRSLNEKQRKYALHILHQIKCSNQPFYELVLGSAGVGKSRLILAIQQSVLRYHRDKAGTLNMEAIRVLLCGPTGKCAFNIKGITCHSAFALPVNQFSSTMPALSSSVRNTLFSKLSECQLIIIDETSMVGSKMLGQINLRLQQIFRSSQPFAGKSILLLGDFNQLPPVGDRMIFEPDRSNVYSELVGNPLWNMFTLYRLTEIMRQRDDAAFAAALNHLAEGCLSVDEVNMFEKCQYAPEPSNSIRLFRTNMEVDVYNNSVFRKQENVLIVTAADKVLGKVSESVKNSLLKSVKSMKTSMTYGLPETLKLSVNVHYMITNNIRVVDGLVNGAIGVLKHIEVNSKSEVICLWLLFDDADVGKEIRHEYIRRAQLSNIDLSYTPIEKVKRNIKARKSSGGIVVRKQFPLVPAEAMTIYKSQGGTYPSAIIHLKKGMKKSEIYVAFSRVTSLKGLVIRGTPFQPPISKSNRAHEVIQKAEIERPVKMALLFLQDYNDNLTVAFHNIQSLRRHIDDLRADTCLTSASLIALVETWTFANDMIDINGYSVVYRENVKRNKRHAYGIVIYVKQKYVSNTNIFYESHCEELGAAHNFVGINISRISVCVGYKPPTTDLSKVKNCITEMIDLALSNNSGSIDKACSDVVVLGDFNIDVRTEGKNKAFTKMFTSRKLRNVIPNKPSTNNGTQIDICFSNINKCIGSFFESYFSYHKPIIFIVGVYHDTIDKSNNNNYAIDKLTGFQSSIFSISNNGNNNDLLNVLRKDTLLVEDNNCNDTSEIYTNSNKCVDSELQLSGKSVDSISNNCIFPEIVISDSSKTSIIHNVFKSNTSLSSEYEILVQSSKENSLCADAMKTSISSKTCNEVNSVTYQQDNSVNKDFKGFTNNDSVSCYANVVCQCLFNIEFFKNAILNGPENLLQSLCKAYFERSDDVLSTTEVRNYVDTLRNYAMFSCLEQQDANEFLEALCEAHPQLNYLVSFNIAEKLVCKHCSFMTIKNEYPNKTLRIELIDGITSLSDLIQIQLSKSTNHAMSCPQCHMNNAMLSSDLLSLPSENKVIIVSLNIFNNYTATKKSVSINDIASEIVIVNNRSYQTKAIISHIGQTINSGHYICDIRLSKTKWVHFNDTKFKIHDSPNCRDAFTLILQIVN